jgi:hypothetical protein
MILNKLLYEIKCQSSSHAENKKMINPMAISITNKNHSLLKKVMIFSNRDFIRRN